MTFDEIAEIEARAAQATGGVWSVDEYQDRRGNIEGYSIMQYSDSSAAHIANLEPYSSNNVEFIAHSMVDIPRLCAALREAMADAARLREGLEAALPYVDPYFVEKHDMRAALEGREPHEEGKP